MGMTVRKLIEELHKMPLTAQVAICAHDQDPERGEFDGSVSSVRRAPDALKLRGCGVVILQ